MDNDTSSSTRIAVLIDCDNVSSKHISSVLEELATYGIPTVKRAYGDWTTSQLTGWKQELLRNAIQPVQQFANTVGKNSTDSALIIDAMDLLWQGNVEAFAIVSSDSDFTRLATRLRESGKRVFGLGRRKTPESLRRAVDQFIFLEVLQEQERQAEASTESEPVTAARPPAVASGEVAAMAPASPDSADQGPSSADTGPEGPSINLQSVLTKAINATSGDDGWAKLSQVGQHLSRAHADFDPRDFGHAKLSSLVDEQPYLDTRTEGSGRQVRLRQKRAAKTTAAKTTPAKTTPAKTTPAKTTPAKTTAAGKEAPESVPAKKAAPKRATASTSPQKAGPQAS